MEFGPVKGELEITIIAMVIVLIIGVILLRSGELFLLLVCYVSAAFISHYAGCWLGEVVPSWLCVFCLWEKIKGEGQP